MIKLKSLLLENSCEKALGKELFAQLFNQGSYKKTKKEIPKNVELDTNQEKTLARIFLSWVGARGAGLGTTTFKAVTGSTEQINKAYSKLIKFKEYANCFPKQLMNQSNTLYRGIYLPLSICKDINLMYKNKSVTATYYPRSKMEAWTDKKDIAKAYSSHKEPLEVTKAAAAGIKSLGDEKWVIPVVIKITGQSNNKDFFVNPPFFEKIATVGRVQSSQLERQTLRMTMKSIKAEFSLNTRSDLVQTKPEGGFMEKDEIEKLTDFDKIKMVGLKYKKHLKVIKSIRVLNTNKSNKTITWVILVYPYSYPIEDFEAENIYDILLKHPNNEMLGTYKKINKYYKIKFKQKID